MGIAGTMMVMMPASRGLGEKVLQPVQHRLARVDLREHEDKILPAAGAGDQRSGGFDCRRVCRHDRTHGQATPDCRSRAARPQSADRLAGRGLVAVRVLPGCPGQRHSADARRAGAEKGIIGLRTVVGKFICSSISLGSGVALGREGPSVQIGAGIASAAGRRLGFSEDQVKSLIPVGTAAAVAAAFNTPLAAVLFTLEEILADLHARVVGTVVIGACTSWIVLRLILGDEPLFHVPAYQLVHPLEFLIYALLGLLGGLVSTAFVKLLLWQRARFLKAPSRWKPFAPAVGGLVVGLLALAAPGVLGVGYNLVSDALNGQMALKVMLLLMVLKLVATATSYSSGNAGGIFGPALFIGAMLGGAVGQVAHTLLPDHTGNAGAYALVGMGAAFAGIVRTPMTSVIMIFEVTRDYTIIVPLMIANLCSYVLAQKLQQLADLRGPVPAGRHHDAVSRSPAGALDRGARHAADAPVRIRHRQISRMALMSIRTTLGLGVAANGTGGCRRNSGDQPCRGDAIGVLHSQDALSAYKQHAGSKGQETLAAAAAQNWLPAVAAITVAAVLSCPDFSSGSALAALIWVLRHTGMARKCWPKDRFRRRSPHFGAPWRMPRRMSSRGPRWVSLSSSQGTSTMRQPTYPGWLRPIPRTARSGWGWPRSLSPEETRSMRWNSIGWRFRRSGPHRRSPGGVAPN